MEVVWWVLYEKNKENYKLRHLENTLMEISHGQLQQAEESQV